jgi:hypothetical protein
MTTADASSSQQIDVSVLGISASQSADVTDQRKHQMAQNDMLRISEFIETQKPLWELRGLEVLDGPFGQLPPNGEIASLINIYA